MQFLDFDSDRETVHAVIRSLIAIGEAASQVSEDVIVRYCQFT